MKEPIKLRNGSYFPNSDNLQQNATQAIGFTLSEVMHKLNMGFPSETGAIRDPEDSDKWDTYRIVLDQQDGSHRVFHIKVELTEVEDTIHDEFWQDRIAKDAEYPEEVAIIQGHHYVIGGEKEFTGFGRGVRGFSGRKFQIKFFDGRVVTTTNLWTQGRIPPKFRHQLPDNAEFKDYE